MTTEDRSKARSTVRLVRAPLQLAPTVDQVVRSIEAEPHPFLLHGRWGLPATSGADARTVVAGASPSHVVVGDDGNDPFAAFDDLPVLEGDAPAGAIGGGLFGWLAFGLGREVERTLGPQPPRPDPLPVAQLGWYDDVLRRDEDGVWWVEALVADGVAAEETLSEAVQRWTARLRTPEVADRTERPFPEPGAAHAADVSTLGRMSPRGGAASHLAAVRETIERIHAGELFQANVCLRLEGELHGPASGLVAPVMARTDPWYGAWIDAGGGRAIVSASPELFLRRQGREVVTGPIKGTAVRSEDTRDASSAALGRQLATSVKDNAEHVMIVDLMRNDLGRVSDYGSIWWDDAPRLEPHAGVWHLVSHVGGRLHDGLGDRALLRATFPPGSVTGAPKVQAMRVIDAVESTGREVYTGAHGFASPVAGLELAVTIRTLEVAGPRAWIGVGGGIVADSNPWGELAEAFDKARALSTAAGGQHAMHGAATRAEILTDRTLGGIPDGAERATSADAPWMRSDDRRPDPARGLLGTLRVEDGRALHLALHLARLDRSLATLGYPPAPADLRDRVEELAATAVAPARLRVLATRPSEPSGALSIELQLIPIMATGVGTGPVVLAPAVVPGGIGPHKYLDRDLIDALTARVGATPLLLDAGGEVLEAGWANVWWLDEKGLATPPLDGRILPGVTRGVLLDRRDGSPVAVREASSPFLAIQDLPLLLTSSRGVSVARLATTPPAALARATDLALALAPLVADDA